MFVNIHTDHTRHTDKLIIIVLVVTVLQHVSVILTYTPACITLQYTKAYLCIQSIYLNRLLLGGMQTNSPT